VERNRTLLDGIEELRFVLAQEPFDARAALLDAILFRHRIHDFRRGRAEELPHEILALVFLAHVRHLDSAKIYPSSRDCYI
jgi:hypothetical protein